MIGEQVPNDSQANGELSRAIMSAFADEFAESHRTKLMSGVAEPVYMPNMDGWHIIYFARGHWASALHETAHWLIAGPERRAQLDYDYWYEPDGRSFAQQRLFEQVEIKPQALEWIMSSALGRDFVASFDNIRGNGANPTAFRQGVRDQALSYRAVGLPARAERFLNRLIQLGPGWSPFKSYWERVSREGILPG